MKMPVSEDCHNEVIDYRQRYRSLKRKFRCVIFENESFQDELKKAQRKLLKLNQDKSFLLDRLLQYERVDDTSSDSDATISSDSDLESFAIKKKKANTPSMATSATTANNHNFVGIGAHSSTARNPSAEPAPKRKKVSTKSNKSVTSKPSEPKEPMPLSLSQGDGHMTSEEIERHLESRQILMDLLPERAPPTVPTEMFSNDPSSLESELNDPGAETSPSNIGDGFTEEDSLIIDLPDQDGCM